MFRISLTAVPSADAVDGFSATADMNKGVAALFVVVVIVGNPKAFDWQVVLGTKAEVEAAHATSSTAESKVETRPIMLSILSFHFDEEGRKNLW